MNELYQGYIQQYGLGLVTGTEMIQTQCYPKAYRKSQEPGTHLTACWQFNSSESVFPRQLNLSKTFQVVRLVPISSRHFNWSESLLCSLSLFESSPQPSLLLIYVWECYKCSESVSFRDFLKVLRFPLGCNVYPPCKHTVS